MTAATRAEPWRLGAHWDGEKTRFALHAPDASAVTLCFFDLPETSVESRRVPLERATGDLWEVELDDAGPGQLYGYRVDGPWRPLEGHLFNRSKLLVDPMARAITGEPRDDPSLYLYEPHAPRRELSFNGRDSAGAMPKCVVVDPAFDWDGDCPPRTPWRDTVIYECHVRGMTKLHPEVDEALRGTYLGLVAPPVLEHLQSLGVTAVELLPVHQIASEPHLQHLGLRNYWGYSPLGFVAPHAGYATGVLGEQVTEFKAMVRKLHRSGIEVILDVVFNHTAEGGPRGPVLSFKGLGNSFYYRLRPRDRTRYADRTGCGNTLDFARPGVRDLVLESLRYWVNEMHVDGFRFDLAPVLGRWHGGEFKATAPFFREIDEDPDLSRVKLVAEPWDVGPNGYLLGQFPSSWAEWNDRYRDSVRSFWRGDPGTLGELATRFAGSRDLFAGKPPLGSVHFVACHDGYTLRDLTSYEQKHNGANGEGNRDGHNHNLSRNWGREGPSDDPEIRAARGRARRNLVATLLLSQGVPMLQHGDEVGRTQRGNNNAYCQDNELTWVDWDVGEDDARFLAFVRRGVEVRRRFPALRREGFPEPGDLVWRHPEGRKMTPDDWAHGRAAAVFVPDEDGDLLLLLNGGETAVRFTVPADVGSTRSWTELLDTSHEAGAPSSGKLGDVSVGAFSLRLFALSPPAAPPAAPS